ncbi:MAG: glutamate 5-kinase [Hyphomicrobiaceae bacterium]|nr:glutamate 5-kinase [Hyphomicrobiaceae bacterium]
MSAPEFSRFRRIVIKIGSALLVDRQTGALKRDWLEALAEDVAGLSAAGTEVLIVSSGAIALGRGLLKLPRGPLKLEESQAAAAVGQIALARAYAETLGRHRLTAGQILLTLSDTEERRRYLNARATLETLLRLKSVPVVNENDTVATSEIRYGDNDRLAARVATMASADCLVLLSDIDGLYTAPPQNDPDARHIAVVDKITRRILSMAGDAGSELSRGGMRTKVEAAQIATKGGTAMVIASGHGLHPLKAIADGARVTWFLASGTPVAARKRWIAGGLETRGTLTVDAGAARALFSGKSLLPAGVRAVAGRFSRGDAVSVASEAGERIAKGLIAYDADEMKKIAGCQSAEIETILGYSGRQAVIHRDDLALTTGEDAPGASPDTEHA